MTINEEMQYCTNCGTANKKSAIICEECEKAIITKHKPFVEFLKRHIKSKLIGKTEDTIFSCIKNFLFSHLYGIVLSITVVTTGVVVAQGNALPSHIKEVVQKPATEAAEAVEQEENTALDLEWCIDYAWHIASEYDGFADRFRNYEPYWEESSRYQSASELYANGNIPGFSYPSVHEMIENPITIGIITNNAEGNHYYEDRYIDEKTVVQGKNATTALGKQLYNDGYNVVECDYVLSATVDNYDYDVRPTDTLERVVYKFVLVEYNDKLYLAEDRLISRKGGV